MQVNRKKRETGSEADHEGKEGVRDQNVRLTRCFGDSAGCW